MLCWFASSLAETNRTPFDFAEGESELVSGFNVEYRRGGFALIFLAEYASIVLICVLTTILFLGGYLYDYFPFFIFTLFQYINFDFYLGYLANRGILFSDPILEGLIYGLSLGLKSCIMIFVFIITQTIEYIFSNNNFMSFNASIHYFYMYFLERWRRWN